MEADAVRSRQRGPLRHPKRALAAAQVPGIRIER